MQMPLVSVIVPVYNVEKYLDRCVESIVNQTYRNLEIILVDDGSPDKCPAMCDEWAKKDSRIKVIHKENGGISDARNVGLNIVRGGEYVSFVDSDDWLDVDMFSTMMQYVGSNTIVCCGIKRDYGDKEKEAKSVNCKKVLSREKFLQLYFSTEIRAFNGGSTGVGSYVWNKIYPVNLFNGIDGEIIRFISNKFCEDIFISAYLWQQRVSFVVLPECLYHYRQREGSLVYNPTLSQIYDLVEARKLWEGLLDDSSKIYAQAMLLTVAAYSKLLFSYYKDLTKDEVKSISEEIKKRLKMISQFDVKLPFVFWVRVFLALHCGRLTTFILSRFGFIKNFIRKY